MRRQVCPAVCSPELYRRPDLRTDSPNAASYFAFLSFFFFQAEDGIRDLTVTGVQTCALPIFAQPTHPLHGHRFAVQLAGEVEQVDLQRPCRDTEGGPWPLVHHAAVLHSLSPRSEERRVGKECRSRWSPYH